MQSPNLESKHGESHVEKVIYAIGVLLSSVDRYAKTTDKADEIFGKMLLDACYIPNDDQERITARVTGRSAEFSQIPSNVQALIRSCFNEEDERPTFQTIAKELRTGYPQLANLVFDSVPKFNLIGSIETIAREWQIFLNQHTRPSVIDYFTVKANDIPTLYLYAQEYEKKALSGREDTKVMWNKAKHYYYRAAEAGDAKSQYKLGVMHAEGHGGPIDLEKAADWLQQAGAQGYAQAQIYLVTFMEKGLIKETGIISDLSRNWFKEAIKKWGPEAQFYLGNLFEEGRGIKKDEKNAAKLYQTAADKHHVPAMLKLAKMYSEGHAAIRKDGTKESDPFFFSLVRENEIKKANDLFSQAANLGDPHAQYVVGKMDEKVNIRTAMSWYRNSAKQGYAPAQYELGVMYAIGNPVPQNEIKALNWFRKAAEQGNTNALHTLGAMYKEGKAKPDIIHHIAVLSQDKKFDNLTSEQIKIIQLECKSGLQEIKSTEKKQSEKQKKVPLSIFFLTYPSILYSSRANSENDKIDYDLIEANAKKGDAEAQNELGGIMYSRSLKKGGNPEDRDKAMELFKQASAKGYVRALCNVGTMYMRTDRLPQDESKALEWYRTDERKAAEYFHKAAEQGCILAQYNLGAMYMTGRGVPRDENKAIEWYQKAADQGCEDSKEALNLIHKKNKNRLAPH